MSNWLVAGLFGVFFFSISVGGLTADGADDLQRAPGVTTLSVGRVGSLVAALVGLTGVVIGGRALRAAGRAGSGSGRTGAAGAVAAGLIGMALGGLVVATAAGGVGTGNGLGGAVVALVIGLISTALGGLALARSRRRAGPLSPIPGSPLSAE